MNVDIEATVRKRLSCQSIRNQPPLVVLHSWPWQTGPWKRIHIDYVGPFLGTMFLVVVNVYFKWLEVLPMNNTTTEKTLDALRTLFARYGLPKKLVSDNRPQLTASNFQEFMVGNGIEHPRSDPYHPRSAPYHPRSAPYHPRSDPYHPTTNGKAERVVQTFKNPLKAGKSDKGTLLQKLSQFLMRYRITPHMTMGVTPTELFLKRQIRTRPDLLKSSTEDHVSHKQAFEVGKRVLALNHCDGSEWVPGKIIAKTGPISY